MTLQHPAVQRLLQMGLVYLAILAFFGELRWGSNAMFLFGSTWIGQAIVTVFLKPRDTSDVPPRLPETR
ncbi:MAG: hypothetical protein IPO52_12390 [Gemmatimonadetes bacterium]|jgi:hypothetical protein|nr:hypothetical protein [Gemmatimonadota bacterium]MBK9549871.1 hypothetical protein [Gemmatimonadota bacterium]MBP6443909.1 hypothetical protein [Gemmatimonadales bacterium]MBP6570433.1 hypothetical protein [Gemmatimonadales bacterium]MBP7619796.1 hypothetical protein [Gemmatimonadales bacterium]